MSTDVEISRTLIRRSAVGTWFEVTDRTTFYDGHTGDFTEIRLYPHAHAADEKPYKLEYAVTSRDRDGRTDYPHTGYYLYGPSFPDGPEFLARRKDDAMREAEVWVAVRITGGSSNAISTGKVPMSNRQCGHCGRTNLVRA